MDIRGTQRVLEIGAECLTRAGACDPLEVIIGKAGGVVSKRSVASSEKEEGEGEGEEEGYQGDSNKPRHDDKGREEMGWWSRVRKSEKT